MVIYKSKTSKISRKLSLATVRVVLKREYLTRLVEEVIT